MGGTTSRRGEARLSMTGAESLTGVAVHRVWLSGGRDAPSGARAALDLLTVEHFDETACDQLRLMVSELVANSVVHGGAGTLDDDIELTVELSRAVLRVECSDPLGGFDLPTAVARAPGGGGFGLEIIGALSSRWGTRHGPAGSTWFEYDRL